MKHIPFCIFIILFALFGNMLSAQESQTAPFVEDYDYLSDAKIDAVIFRGPIYVKYPYRFDGTFYAYSDEFLESRINYNGKEFKGVKLNLNANRDELYIQMYGAGMIIVLEKDYVKDFSLGERNFINHTEGDGIEGLEYGYYELLYKGKDMLLKKIKQNFNEKFDNVGSATLKSFYPAYTYYVVKDGKAVTLKGRSAFAKIYKPYKGQINGFIKERRLKFAGKEANDKVFTLIMEYIDTKQQ